MGTLTQEGTPPVLLSSFSLISPCCLFVRFWGVGSRLGPYGYGAPYGQSPYATHSYGGAYGAPGKFAPRFYVSAPLMVLLLKDMGWDPTEVEVDAVEMKVTTEEGQAEVFTGSKVGSRLVAQEVAVVASMGPQAAGHPDLTKYLMPPLPSDLSFANTLVHALTTLSLNYLNIFLTWPMLVFGR